MNAQVYPTALDTIRRLIERGQLRVVLEAKCVTMRAEVTGAHRLGDAIELTIDASIEDAYERARAAEAFTQATPKIESFNGPQSQSWSAIFDRVEADNDDGAPLVPAASTFGAMVGAIKPQR